MAIKKRKFSGKAKSTKRNLKKTASKAKPHLKKAKTTKKAKRPIQKAPQAPAGTEASVTIYEVIEGEVYREPGLVIEEQEEEFGT